MNQYIRSYYLFLKANPQNIDGFPFHSLLDEFWPAYAQRRSIDQPGIQERFHALDPILNQLSRKRQEALIRAIVDLCVEHEHTAFIDGVHVGARLFIELYDPDDAK